MIPHVHTALAAFVVLATLLIPMPASADCGCVPPPGPGAYGSGDLGDWTQWSRAISAPARVAEADVWILGDSITYNDWAALATELRDRHGLVTAAHAWAGRPTTPTVDALAEWVAAHGPPRLVIMGSGTNDIFGPSSQGPPIMAGQIDRAMAIVGPDVPVIWVEVHISRWLQAAHVQVNDQRNSGWVNGLLWEATRRHPNLSISIWERYLSAVPDRVRAYLTDGVHTNRTSGMWSRNELLRQEIVRRLGL